MKSLLIAWAAMAPLFGHDMWIEPTTFFPAAGQIVGARLQVGQDFLGDPLPRNPALIKRFVVEDAQGEKPLVGRDGGDPAGYFRVASAGLLVVGYFSNPSAVELDSGKFNQYLQDEGLDSVAAVRARRNQTGSGARELFSRCAKSLVLSGPASDKQADHQLGFPLELLAERNPYLMRAGGDLPVRLMWRNRPLQGALIVAINRLHPGQKVFARTDPGGDARFRLPSDGVWLIKAVHMIPAPEGSGADWASYWASLTFELRN